MQQFGLALQALEPQLGLAETDREMRSAMAVVWLPWRLAGRSTDLKASWDVTSNSIACWLATRLGAGELVLVKSAEIARDHDTDRLLSVPGLVDPAFAHYRQRFAGRVRTCIAKPGQASPAIRLDGGQGLPWLSMYSS